MLKINFPEPESEHEADALAHWDGVGAVRLLEHDRERDALLLERCVPGTRCGRSGTTSRRRAIAAGVLRRLWRPAPGRHPFRPLADEAARWADELPGELGALGGRSSGRSSTPPSRSCASRPRPAEQVVLPPGLPRRQRPRAQREPWLAIDPKPLVGERAFDAPRSCDRGRCRDGPRRPGAVRQASRPPRRPSSASTASGCAAGASSRARLGLRRAPGPEARRTRSSARGSSPRCLRSRMWLVAGRAAVEVEPSLYAADFARLGEQIDVLLDAGVRVFHFDVGDGHFVEPITIGPIVLESIAAACTRAAAYSTAT